jgi:hypothetical protein
MAVQRRSVEWVLDMSGGVCEPRHENGSTVHRAAVCHLFLFVLNSVTMPSRHMENFSRPLEMMQCQEHKPFSVRTLAEDEQRSGRPSAKWAGHNTDG